MASVSSNEILNWDMKVIVKQYTSEHFEGWVRLRQCLWPDDTLDEHRRYAESILNRPSDAVVYLACEDREVIAFGEATLRRDYVNGCRSSPIGFLEGLYVKPHYRRRGLARLISGALEDWAKGIGCTEFASDVLLSNKTGQRVHEALGFNESDRVVFYVKRL
jgi:aminoglycoside 6'-N-acetyltransferase I